MPEFNLTKKLGPLPVWAWGLVIGGAVLYFGRGRLFGGSAPDATTGQSGTLTEADYPTSGGVGYMLAGDSGTGVGTTVLTGPAGAAGPRGKRGKTGKTGTRGKTGRPGASSRTTRTLHPIGGFNNRGAGSAPRDTHPAQGVVGGVTHAPAIVRSKKGWHPDRAVASGGLARPAGVGSARTPLAGVSKKGAA